MNVVPDYPVRLLVGVRNIALHNVFQAALCREGERNDVLIALLFFLLLSLAALTSLISLHEVSTAFIHEDLQTTRRKAAFIVTVVTAVIGTFCSLSLGAVEGLSLFGRSLFDCFDFLTGQILLPVGGFLTCLFLGWYVPRQVVYDEFTNGGTLRGRFFQFFLFLVRFVCPLAILCIFLDELGVI